VLLDYKVLHEMAPLRCVRTRPGTSRNRLVTIHVLRGVLPAWQQNGLTMSQGWKRRIDNHREMSRRQTTRNANCARQPRENLDEGPHLPLLLVFFFHSRNVPVVTRERLAGNPRRHRSGRWSCRRLCENI